MFQATARRYIRTGEAVRVPGGYGPHDSGAKGGPGHYLQRQTGKYMAKKIRKKKFLENKTIIYNNFCRFRRKNKKIFILLGVGFEPTRT